ncbi:MAG TPA: redox-regulated ATPase YchF [Thermoanaerobacterales bacterium]|nr:redox-regulated ATPase YchF [Thermoanaerobacterales bacterium]
MKIGIIGLTTSGKTTLFNLLTKSEIATEAFSSGKWEANIGMANVPDKRIDFLSDMFKPKKTTYAQIQFIDVPGLEKGGGADAAGFLEVIRQVDAVVHVVRAFENNLVPHSEGLVDPLRDIDVLTTELLFADLAVIENRLRRMEEDKKLRKGKEKEIEVLNKCKDILEDGKPISTAGLTESELDIIKSYSFISEKPMLIVVNLDEGQFEEQNYPTKDELNKYAKDKNIPVIELSALLEMEIDKLEDEDKRLFMDELSIKEPGISLVARKIYDYLGLISFFTVGEDEVKSWSISKGTVAKKAAGVIHSDLERGFIRAETIAYDDLKESGSISAARGKGLFRLEGKEYLVQDGDIINIRFNI